MRGAAGESTEVTGERADVRASAAGDRYLERRGVAMPDAPHLHVDGNGVELEGRASARGCIRSLARTLLCRVVGGSLLDAPCERDDAAIDGSRVG